MVTTIILSAVSSLIGTFFGAYLITAIQNKRTVKTRKTADKALSIFEKYASRGGLYCNAEDEFNVSLNIVEKRSILVALHKLGVPVADSVGVAFDIRKVHFMRERIDKEEIQQMKSQVKMGNCDNLFYLDVESVFSANMRTQTIRNIAKKYVDEDLSTCTFEKQSQNIHHKVILSDIFSPGEINTILVFREVTANALYYNENGNVVKESLEKLKNEIDLGLWDMYLFWDYSSYKNLQAQYLMANNFSNSFPAFLQGGVQKDERDLVR